MEKRKPGRPTKYKPEYCEKLVQHMADGYSFESFGGKVDVGRESLYRWEAKHQEFRDAKKRGSTKSQLHWEHMGRLGLGSKTFNATVWIFNMKNRFGWRDRTEQEVNVKHERYEDFIKRTMKK